MSGGVAYVLDETGDFATRCNMELVALEKLEDTDEIEEVWKLVQRTRRSRTANAPRRFSATGRISSQNL